MAKAYECTFFCVLSYHEDLEVCFRLPARWQLIETSLLSDTGTKCLALINKRLIIAIQGYRILKKWGTNFTKLVTYQHTITYTCYDEVKYFVYRIRKEYQFLYKGHSLREHLAKLRVCENQAHVITFKSTNFHEIIGNIKLPWKDTHTYIYLSELNIANTLYGYTVKIRHAYFHHISIHSYALDKLKDDLGNYFSAIIELLKRHGLASLAGLSNLKYLKNVHSTVFIIKSFNVITKKPILHRNAYHWPSYIKINLFNHFLFILNKLFEPKYRANQSMEYKLAYLPNYKVHPKHHFYTSYFLKLKEKNFVGGTTSF